MEQLLPVKLQTQLLLVHWATTMLRHLDSITFLGMDGALILSIPSKLLSPHKISIQKSV